MTRSWWLLCWGLALLGLGGCASLHPAQAGDPAPGTVMAADPGRALTGPELAQRLEKTQVLLVGEVHDHPGHHAIQLDLLKAMEQPGSRLVVGVEWLDWLAQDACERLSRGEVSVEEFARLADWDRRWGFALAIYAPILERVRQQGHRLVALNAPVEVVRRVAQQGLAALQPGQRALLAPALDMDDPPYSRRMLEMARAHGLQEPQALENFFAAQVARDDTMAWRLALALQPWPDGGGRAVVLAGGGHISDGQGLPPRIKRLLPGARLTTVLPVAAEALREPIRVDTWPADLLVTAAPAPPRLGLVLKLEAEGIRVERVFPESPAARAGFLAGDLLLAVNGRPLRQTKDIHDAIRPGPAAPHIFRLLRGEREGNIRMMLRESGS